MQNEPIWKHSPTLEALNSLSEGTSVAYLGIVFTAIGPDYLEASLQVDHRTIQPFGILHGGVSAHLAETLGSVASSLCVEDPFQSRPVGIELNATHLKSASIGSTATGRVTPVRLGKTLHVWDIRIRDQKGEQLCISRLTVLIRK